MTHEEKYSGNSVIERGYEIYDEWNHNRSSSAGVVSFVEHAAALVHTEGTKRAYAEALSCVFALDMRIKERYSKLFSLILFFFSWRREKRAQSRLKGMFHISENEMDVHTAIELALKKLRESLDDEWKADGDDEAHGGKRNGRAEEETATEEKEAETAEENAEAEELSDEEEKEKTSKEKEEKPIEEEHLEESREETGGQKEAAEPEQKEAETAVPDKKEELEQKKDEKLKEEKNASDVESEPSTDNKKEETKTYDDAVDFLPLYEETELNTSKKKTSIIDEMIMDSMIKGDKSIIGYRTIDDINRSRGADSQENTAAPQNEEGKSTDKDAYLYDKISAADKGEAQNGNLEAEPMQSSDNVNSAEQEINSSSDMLKTDNLNADKENDLANELNNTMSTESKLAYVRMQEDMMREQLSIALEELGIDDTVEIVRISEPDEVASPSVVQNGNDRN